MIRLLTPIVILAVAFTVSAFAIFLIGENPLYVFQVIFNSAFGSAEGFSYTLFYATPLLLTGASVALALQAGLFNIGAEGQLYMGAIGAAAWGIFSSSFNFTGEFSILFKVLTVFTGGIFAFAFGALWGGIAGLLKAKFETHEVIATILLNFIAYAFANWCILYPLKNLNTQNIETLPIATSLQLPRIWGHTTGGILLAVVIAVIVLIAIKHTWWGYRLRATGLNPVAARFAGVSVSKMTILALALSGGISGLVGFNEVFFSSYKLVNSFSPGFGFTGVAIALIARGNLFSLIASTLLMAGLYKGALDLDIETEKITRDFSAVIQALILVTLAAHPAIAKLVSRLERKQTT